jgi:ATP synthase protein I
MLAALSDGQRAYSSALGGATAVIPNLCFAFFLSRARNKPAKTLINQFYRGEISKWLLTAALFTIALQQSGIDFLSMLGTYIAAVSVFWFALLIR